MFLHKLHLKYFPLYIQLYELMFPDGQWSSQSIWIYSAALQPEERNVILEFGYSTTNFWLSKSLDTPKVISWSFYIVAGLPLLSGVQKKMIINT